MNHRTGLDRSQTLLFPERLEDYVAARCTRAAALTDEISEQQKTGDLKNRPPVKLFHSLRRSIHTGSRFVSTPTNLRLGQ